MFVTSSVMGNFKMILGDVGQASLISRRIMLCYLISILNKRGKSATAYSIF